MGIKQHLNCTFCKESPETIEHLFWDCEKVSHTLRELQHYLVTNSINLNFDKQEFIFGQYNSAEVDLIIDNLIILLIKQYIFKSKCLEVELNTTSLKNHILFELKSHKWLILNHKTCKNNLELQSKAEKWLLYN